MVRLIENEDSYVQIDITSIIEYLYELIHNASLADDYILSDYDIMSLQEAYSKLRRVANAKNEASKRRVRAT